MDTNGENAKSYKFKSFRLSVGERQLLRDDVPVALSPKVFDVLVELVSRSGHLVRKDELMRTVWTDSFVEEGNLTRAIHVLRKALGEDQNGNTFIVTIPTKGYRFVAETFVEREADNAGESDANGFDRRPAEPTSAIDYYTEGESVNDEREHLYRSRFPRRKAAVVGSGLVLIVFAVLFLGTGTFDNEGGVKSLAVLPLRPMLPENRDPVYENAIANSLIRKLRSATGVEVRPFSVTQTYIDKEVDPVAAGREQGVDYIVTSEYQVADGKFRVYVRLVNVKTGSIEAEFSDEQIKTTIFAVQDQVAASVGHRLLTRLSRSPGGDKPNDGTANEEAYGNYWMGRLLVDKQNAKDAVKAISYLERAVELDPNYALAYAALAGAHGTYAMSGGDKREHFIKARDAIEKALSIDDNLAEAHARMGMIKMTQDWDFAGAERAFQRSLELDTYSAISNREYAVFLNSMGRFDESIARIKTSLRFEPASVLNNRIYGMILFYARRYPEAITQLERTVDLDPEFRGAYGFLCSAYSKNSEFDKAFECFLRSPARKAESPSEVEAWKSTYAKDGWPGIIRKTIEDSKVDEDTSRLSGWDLANLYGELGEKDKALDTIERSIGRGGWGWTLLKVNPSLDSLRPDTRYTKLLQRVGLE